tara:strand:- start:18053 stop:18340 length:288 start_codon:yes stop_codon:yes gene_type:complete
MFILSITSVAAQDVNGKPEVFDGDTIKIEGERIRLHGMDAPEKQQTCHMGAEEYGCGVEAANSLSALVGGQSVTCEAVDRDRYGRTVAKCLAGQP